MYSYNELSMISIAFFLHRNCEFLIDFTRRYFISSVTMRTIKTWKKELLVSKIGPLSERVAPINSLWQNELHVTLHYNYKIDLAKAKSEPLSSTFKNCLVKKKSYVSLRSLENLNWSQENLKNTSPQ